jgi:hypothetical protein
LVMSSLFSICILKSNNCWWANPVNWINPCVSIPFRISLQSPKLFVTLCKVQIFCVR